MNRQPKKTRPRWNAARMGAARADAKRFVESFPLGACFSTKECAAAIGDDSPTQFRARRVLQDMKQRGIVSHKVRARASQWRREQ